MTSPRFLRLAIAAILMTIIVVSGFYFAPAPTVPSTLAADHGDSPIASNDRAGDLADVYAFLDPNDNSRVVLMVTITGFIVPGEAVNFGLFDPGILYRFNLEMTGDAVVDKTIDVRFSPKTQSSSQAQTATIKLMDGRTFTAPTTVPTLNQTAPPRVITTDQATGVQFFAGIVDDPFRFDIPGFSRFRASAIAAEGNLERIDGNTLKRGRDTFAGYNIHAIAFSFPISMFQSAANNEFGVEVVTSRTTTIRRGGRLSRNSVNSITTQIDRCANPAVNVALIPFPLKDDHNLATTRDDASGKFANTIVEQLRSLGTNENGINLIRRLAITRGDFVRLDMTAPNSGPMGGNNGATGFPNGRRLIDDVVDTNLTVITNGFITTDNANDNDVPFTNTFPFFGEAHQPREPGVVNDQTRN
ncbi:MAG: DUF4331 domain-containing protein [Pyrinomonadaceae bacterium MAG19_C2-C3]|nr:DUF4331 domain-containing protein [Pyrinomonadaceae bacterium MAG19_C2-C3]